MFDFSLKSANLLFGLSNVSLIIGGMLVLLGSAGVFWFGGIREKYADIRISGNEAQTASAVAASARANAETAKLTESNTRLKLQLEKERAERLRLEEKVAPRKMSARQHEVLQSRFSESGWVEAEIIWHGTGEPELYADEFVSAFKAAGIEVRSHTLGPFLPSAWGLLIVRSTNDTCEKLKAIFDEAGIEAEIAESNDTIGMRAYPLLVVGARED